MNYEEIVETYRIEDICPEIDNELNGMFIDLLGDDFSMGIFPEPNPDDEEKFLVTVEISAENCALDDGAIEKIKTSVAERLAHNIGKDWKKIEGSFGGVQIFLNDEGL